MLTRIGFILLATASISRGDPAELLRAKAAFEHLKRPSEEERVHYIVHLIGLRQRYAKLADQQWRWDVDAEILSRPAPPATATYVRRIVGKWRSPRHDYLYRANSTFTTLPVEPDSLGIDGALTATGFFRRSAISRTNSMSTQSYYSLMSGWCSPTVMCIITPASNHAMERTPKAFGVAHLVPVRRFHITEPV
jgi:hypothetical protein